MFILKHLQTLQQVSITIQTIFRELVCSLLMSLILKFVKNVKSQCGDAEAKYLVCVRTHTHQMFCFRITALTFYIFNKF